MNDNLVVSGSIDVNADAAAVWKTLTSPEIIKEYLYGTETITDWKMGSEIVFQGVYKEQVYRDKGVILENVLHKRLSYTYWSGFSGLEDEPENYSLVTYLLESEANGYTKFTWVQKGFATQDGYEHSKEGMPAFLEQIKSIMERI